MAWREKQIKSGTQFALINNSVCISDNGRPKDNGSMNIKQN